MYGRQGWGSRVGCGAVNGGWRLWGVGMGRGELWGAGAGGCRGAGMGEGQPPSPSPFSSLSQWLQLRALQAVGLHTNPPLWVWWGGGVATKPLLWGRGFGGGGSQPHLPSVPHCPQGHPSLCPPQTRFVPLGRVGMGHNGGPMGLGGEMRRHGGMEPIWVRGHNSNGRLYGAGSGAGMLGELLPPPAL